MSTTHNPDQESLRDVLLAKAQEQGGNDRTAQRVRGRLAFQAHLQEIKDALKGSASKRFIWEAMKERGLLDVSYRTFLNWCADAGIPGRRLSAEAAQPEPTQQAEKAAQSSAPPKFKHNSNPSRGDLFAPSQKKKDQ